MTKLPAAVRNGLVLLYGLFVLGSTFSIAIAQSALGLSLMLFVVIVIVWKHQPFVPPLRSVYLMIGLYVAGMLIAGLMNSTPFKSVEMIKEEWLFSALLVGIAVMQFDGVPRRLITLFSIGVCFISLYSIIQHFTGWHPLKPSFPVEASEYGWRVEGNFTHPLTFANYYGTAACVLLGYALVQGDDLSRRARIWFLTVASLAGISVMFALSRGPAAALLATLVVGVIIVGRKFQRLTIGALVVVLVGVAISSGLVLRYADQQAMDFGGKDEGGRVFIWSRAAEIIRSNPVFGVGQGNFSEEYSKRIRPEARATRNMAHAHNDPLTVGAISGIPTALAFLGMWAAVLWLLWRGYRKPDISTAERRLFLASLLGAVVFLLGSMTEATFSDEEVRQMLMFVWAIGLAVWYKRVLEPDKTIGDRDLTTAK